MLTVDDLLQPASGSSPSRRSGSALRPIHSLRERRVERGRGRRRRRHRRGPAARPGDRCRCRRPAGQGDQDPPSDLRPGGKVASPSSPRPRASTRAGPSAACRCGSSRAAGRLSQGTVLTHAPDPDVIRHVVPLPERPGPESAEVEIVDRGAYEIGVIEGADDTSDEVGPPTLPMWIRFPGAPHEAIAVRRSPRSPPTSSSLGRPCGPTPVCRSVSRTCRCPPGC